MAPTPSEIDRAKRGKMSVLEQGLSGLRNPEPAVSDASNPIADFVRKLLMMREAGGPQAGAMAPSDVPGSATSTPETAAASAMFPLDVGTGAMGIRPDDPLSSPGAKLIDMARRNRGVPSLRAATQADPLSATVSPDVPAVAAADLGGMSAPVMASSVPGPVVAPDVPYRAQPVVPVQTVTATNVPDMNEVYPAAMPPVQPPFMTPRTPAEGPPQAPDMNERYDFLGTKGEPGRSTSKKVPTAAAAKQAAPAPAAAAPAAAPQQGMGDLMNFFMRNAMMQRDREKGGFIGPTGGY